MVTMRNDLKNKVIFQDLAISYPINLQVDIYYTRMQKWSLP